MRIGYLTVPPTDARPRGAARRRVLSTQVAAGYSFPNALPPARARGPRGAVDRHRGARAAARPADRRDARRLGYETTMPEGTFYIMARSPIADDEAFADDPRRAQGARPAGRGRRGAGLVPDQPDRLRRDGRARASALRGRVRRGQRRVSIKDVPKFKDFDRRRRLRRRRRARRGRASRSSLKRGIHAGWTSSSEMRKRLADALGDTALRIEHVGSTAIPGIAGQAHRRYPDLRRRRRR